MFWQYVETYYLNMAISNFFSLEIWLYNIIFPKKNSLVGFALHFCWGCLMTKNHQKKQHWFQWSHKHHKSFDTFVTRHSNMSKKNHWHNLEGCYNIFVEVQTNESVGQFCPSNAFWWISGSSHLLDSFVRRNMNLKRKKKSLKKSKIYLWIWCHYTLSTKQKKHKLVLCVYVCVCFGTIWLSCKGVGWTLTMVVDLIQIGFFFFFLSFQTLWFFIHHMEHHYWCFHPCSIHVMKRPPASLLMLHPCSIHVMKRPASLLWW